MKLSQKLIASTCSLSALVTTAYGQTPNLDYTPLPFHAASYDLFVLDGADGGDAIMDFDDEGNFNGLMGIGQFADVQTGGDLIFGGEVQRHTNVNDSGWDADNQPGAIINALGINDPALNLANTQIQDYITQLNSLTITLDEFGDPSSYTPQNSSFLYNSTGSLNVLDFQSISLKGTGESFTLNGRAGFDDTFIIRMNNDSIFEDGAPVILNNLDRRNVIWLMADGNEFDLHSNDGANFEGVIINPTEESGKNIPVIIGDVNFTGQVYAPSMKLGTGVVFEGSSITDPVPEPTPGMLLLFALGSLTFVRRRR